MISKTIIVTTTARLILTRLDKVIDGSGGRMATGGSSIVGPFSAALPGRVCRMGLP
ncbi:MAG TPA: hypothetical protein VGJ59_18655 [Jatrophihabitantaceae bacterium]